MLQPEASLGSGPASGNQHSRSEGLLCADAAPGPRLFPTLSWVLFTCSPDEKTEAQNGCFLPEVTEQRKS